MGFCMNCGAQVPDGAKFCNVCGTPYGSLQPATNSASTVSASLPERQKSLDELQRMGKYFGQKQAVYDEYDHLMESMPILEIQAKNGSKGAIVWGIILTVMGVTMGCTGLIGAIAMLMDDNILAAIALTLFGLLLGGGVLLGGLFLLIIMHKKSKKDAQGRYENAQRRLYELTDDLVQHFNRYGYCLVGMEYTNPKITNIIYNVIRQGRADTPKEAINVMLQDAHRSEMELRATQSAAANRSSAISDGITAAFIVASFFR